MVASWGTAGLSVIVLAARVTANAKDAWRDAAAAGTRRAAFIASRKPLRCTSRCARRRFHAPRAGIGPGGETR
ncbi:hypothetical protein BCCH1_56400 [Burkholderia contaminans]|uniref:Uncharacterized protein n=1 Tax=Burkholderia contaminans TaxID=488447 RepID=A0A250LEW7_9BURK|nr:hypothetical protein BCCH1_56400 [Burkholderia contaminans]GLZ73134.1 hypothetical protein Bcon01_61790 [Burkholderia contaminans]